MTDPEITIKSRTRLTSELELVNGTAHEASDNAITFTALVSDDRAVLIGGTQHVAVPSSQYCFTQQPVAYDRLAELAPHVHSAVHDHVSPHVAEFGEGLSEGMANPQEHLPGIALGDDDVWLAGTIRSYWPRTERGTVLVGHEVRTFNRSDWLSDGDPVVGELVEGRCGPSGIVLQRSEPPTVEPEKRTVVLRTPATITHYDADSPDVEVSTGLKSLTFDRWHSMAFEPVVGDTVHICQEVPNGNSWLEMPEQSPAEPDPASTHGYVQSIDDDRQTFAVRLDSGDVVPYECRPADACPFPLHSRVRLTPNVDGTVTVWDGDSLEVTCTEHEPLVPVQGTKTTNDPYTAAAVDGVIVSYDRNTQRGLLRLDSEALLKFDLATWFSISSAQPDPAPGMSARVGLTQGGEVVYVQQVTSEDHPQQRTREPILLDDEIVAGLAPGVHDLVLALNAAGFHTCDSGDGSNHAEGMECAVPFRLIAIMADPDELCSTADDLATWIAEAPEFDWPRHEIAASYDPANGVALVALYEPAGDPTATLDAIKAACTDVKAACTAIGDILAAEFPTTPEEPEEAPQDTLTCGGPDHSPDATAAQEASQSPLATVEALRQQLAKIVVEEARLVGSHESWAARRLHYINGACDALEFALGDRGPVLD